MICCQLYSTDWDQLLLNANGKTDRPTLAKAYLEAERRANFASKVALAGTKVGPGHA